MMLILSNLLDSRQTSVLPQLYAIDSKPSRARNKSDVGERDGRVRFNSI